MFTIPSTNEQITFLVDDFEFNKIINLIKLELYYAQNKFPKWPKDLNYGDQIINEEKGEATKALIDIHQNKSSLNDLRKEYIQTITMCIRQISAINYLIER